MLLAVKAFGVGLYKRLTLGNKMHCQFCIRHDQASCVKKRLFRIPSRCYRLNNVFEPCAEYAGKDGQREREREYAMSATFFDCCKRNSWTNKQTCGPCLPRRLVPCLERAFTQLSLCHVFKRKTEKVSDSSGRLICISLRRLGREGVQKDYP